MRIYHRHQSIPTFQRRISYVVDSRGQIVQYAVVQYLFEYGREVPVILLPHGNAKHDNTPYRRTQTSTLSMMKNTTGKPKSVVSYLCNEKGGIMGAASCSELPRNRRQVYNSQCLSASSKNSNPSGRADPIFDLIQQCSVDLAPGGRKFI